MAPFAARTFLVGFLFQALALALRVPLRERAAAVTPIAAAYYPDFGTSPAPTAIDYSKYNVIFYAFAVPDASYDLTWASGSQDTLKNLVSLAHSSGQGTKVVLSIGGGSGSYYFSEIMSTAANRATFLNTLTSAVSTYDLDGLDIDWEYPGTSGPSGGNPYSSADTANFLTFLTSLRSAIGSSKIISATVLDQTFIGANGSPITDASAYAAQLTYINIMNYDVHGSSSTPGPNAPLGSCSTTAYSAQAALAQWTAAGVPAAQLLLGVPFYGYVSQSTATTLSSNTPITSAEVSRVRPESIQSGDSAAAGGDLSSYWGEAVSFNTLISAGALEKQADGSYAAINGYTRVMDSCSTTPYLYDVARTTVVTYDDPESLQDKAAFVKSSGMAGCFAWRLDQDDGTSLQSAVRAGLGLS